MSYINENFLLENEIAVKLYHDYAKHLPILDYHNHLDANEIKHNKTYNDLSDIWLKHDHYKWRIMRSCGIEEELCSGNGEPYAKFLAFVKSVQRAYGNPVYHFSQLELKKYFDINDLINEKNAKYIWEKSNEIIRNKLSVRQIIEKSNVHLVCTTDDPLDSLEHHFISGELEVRPTFRPDQALKINVPWIKELGDLVGFEIVHYEDLVYALEIRLEYFVDHGCLLSDHSLERFVYVDLESADIDVIFSEVMNGKKIPKKEQFRLMSKLLVDLGKMYSKFGIVMQLHIGALRNNSERRHKELGKDKGFDSVDDYLISKNISRLFDELDKKDELPKAILYNSNPTDNVMLATMAANFQSSGVKSKIQFGPAWWFNDHKKGMINQLTDYANHGVLGNFIGMLTDSRSYLSFSRHEYFRRVLCNLVGEWATKGEISNDIEELGSLVEDICYYNIKEYLGLGGRDK